MSSLDPVRPNPVRLFRIISKPPSSSRDDIKIGDVAECLGTHNDCFKLFNKDWDKTLTYAWFEKTHVVELDPTKRKIKDDLSKYRSYDLRNSHDYVASMEKYTGRIVTVTSMTGDFYRFNEIEYRWHKDMVEYVPLNQPKTPKPSTPENGMRKLDFTAKREIPTTGHVMAIRNKRMHSYNHNTRLFTPVLGSIANEFHADSLLDTDILYNFPTPETPYEYVVKGKCLDEFKVEAENSAQSIKAKLIELLKNGAFITRNKNEVLKLKDGNTIQGFHYKDGTITAKDMCGFSEFPFYQFDNEFEMFAVLYQKS